MRLLALRVLLAASTFLACSSACSNLKRADEAPDGGAAGDDSGMPPPDSGDDAGGLPDSAVADSAVPDAGAPPVDFACAADAWTKVAKTKPECAPRQVKVVTALAPIDPTGVSIARTSTGRVGIVFNDEGPTEGEMHLFHFTPTTATYAAPKLVTPTNSLPYFHYGYRTKLSAIAPDTLAVLAFDKDDGTGIGDVNLVKLVGGVEPLTTAQIVVPAVKDPTEIAVASDPAGNVYATARVATGATSAKLVAKAKTPAGAFTVLPDVATTPLVVSDPTTPQYVPPNAGAASLLVDLGGQVHLLYHQDEVLQHSAPRYHTLAGTTWSYRKTIDNNVPNGICGYSPRIAVFGTKKYAAYYFRAAQQANPNKAELRLATWQVDSDVPTIEILDQSIPSGTLAAPSFAYRVAMAVDKFGLVHLAILRPTSATAGYLEYRRQTPNGSGGTKWLSDIVDPDCMSDISESFVDMVVDENARPHIAYRSGKDGLVKYATRFDR